MAVFTKLNRKEITGFLAQYDVGVLVSAEGIAEGIENTNYLIATKHKRYILTLFEQRTNPTEVQFFMELTEWLARRGIPCPRPIIGRDGKTIRKVKNKAAVLVEFLYGKGNPNVTLSHVEQIGELLATMHLAAQDFPHSRKNTLSISGWKKIYGNIHAHVDAISPGLSATIKKEIAYLEKHWPKNLPFGLIHGDVFPDNVFFKQDRLSGVIDFYFACNDLWMYDLMITLNAWCFNGVQQFLPARAKALLQAYHNIRPITPAERAAMPVLGRGAALRFLLTRSHDWLHHDPKVLVTPKNPLEYLEKLTFHQQQTPLSPL